MEERLAYVPNWRSDETLYSWAAGFHAILGNRSARDTGTLLFGSEHACRDRDAPRNLIHFSRKTGFALGSVQSLLFHRTPLGLFIPFLTDPRKQRLLTQLEVSTGPGWRLLCGMPASGLHDSTLMHYCDQCVAEDLVNWGLPRWRLPHQLPGSWVCLDHDIALCAVRSHASQWILPPAKQSGQETPVIQCDELEALKQIASLAFRLVGSGTLDLDAVRQALLVGLRDHDITTWRHPLNSDQLSSWFMRSPVAGWLRRSDGPWRQLAGGEWIHDLLRNRVGDHPLKWMILWSTLFAGQDVNASQQRFITPGSAPHWDANGQATIWGATPPSIPADIHDVIATASTLKVAAQTLGISVSTLRHRLADLGTSPRSFRLDVGFMRRKQRAVDAIRSYIESHPACTRADIHRNCKAAVEWIRLNAPDAYAEAVESLVDFRSRQMSLPTDD